MPLTSLADLLGRNGSKIGTTKLQLPDSVVTHDTVDRMMFLNYADDSKRFRHMVIEDAPPVPVDVPEVPAIDMSTATPKEFIAYQTAVRERDVALKDAPTYSQWDKLTRDVFYSYHHHDQPAIVEPVDPRVELHKRIVPKMTTTDDHARSRNVTRDDATMSAIATMAATKALRQALGDELEQQAKEQQKYEHQVRDVEQIIDQLGDLRGEAQDYMEQGQPVPGDLKGQIKQLVRAKRDGQQKALQLAEVFSPMSQDAMDAIEAAAKAGSKAAEAAGGLPNFGAGFGAGEPVYESPEQALTIAEMWANNPNLRAMAELFGRLDKDIRFKRANRVVGGNDEIVDLEFGDNLKRVIPSELALLSDPDYEDDFFVRYAANELLCYSTVGEEHAGRGPIVCVVDGSGSMNGERNIWARAIAMCLLHIARREKRDFACIEFASAGEVETWLFRGKEALDAQQILDMASHFYGGGTRPLQGVAGAAKVMQDAAEFRKADIVLVGDGDAGFSDEDKRLREHLTALGVRFFGLAIGTGQRYRYLESYCGEHVVHVSDFELTDPSQATAELAVHVS